MAVLLRFYDASRAEDRARLAAICRAVSDSAGAGEGAGKHRAVVNAYAFHYAAADLLVL